VEVEVWTETLDRRGMVVDFGDVKRVVKRWIDREIDHRMILRRSRSSRWPPGRGCR